MNEKVGHIFIDEQITPETYAMVKKSLAEFSNRDQIVLHIASPGGSVYAGYNIYNALKLAKKPIKTIIEGEAQSMATFIALAGDEIEICNPSVFMIHMPHSGVEGTRENFIQGASELETIENDMVAAYAAKTKLPPEQIREMMRKTTTLNASQAKEFGFADKVLGSYSQAVALGQTIKKSMEKKETVLTKIIKMAADVLGDGPKSMEYKTKEGQMVTISEDGKMATIDGQPATGSILLEDGRTLIAENGAVISIQEAAAAPQPAPAPQPQPAPVPQPAPQQTAEQKLAEALAKLAAAEAEKQALEAKAKKDEEAIAAAEQKATSAATALGTIKKEAEALSKEPVGDQGAPSKGMNPIISPSARRGPQAEGIEQMVMFLNEHFSWVKQYYPKGHFEKYIDSYTQKHGPQATSILETDLNYTWPGITTTDIFYKPTHQAPALADIFTIDQGIKDRKIYNLVTQLDKILKPYTGCERTFNNNRQLITNTEVQTKEFNVAESWCKDDFTNYLVGRANIFVQEWMKDGIKSFDPTGTPLATLIDRILIDALQRDVFRRTCFAAGNSSDDDYNQFDGLWDRLIDSSGASNYCVRRAGSALGTGALAAGDGLTALEAVYADSDLLLKNAPSKKYEVTRSIWENYYNSLAKVDANYTEEHYKALLAGKTTLTYKGIPIVPIDLWDVFLAESDNPLFATTRHLVLLTVKENHILGVEQGNDLNKIEGWYERKDRKFYYEADMKFGYNYLHCDLQTIAY